MVLSTIRIRKQAAIICHLGGGDIGLLVRGPPFRPAPFEGISLFIHGRIPWGSMVSRCAEDPKRQFIWQIIRRVQVLPLQAGAHCLAGLRAEEQARQGESRLSCREAAEPEKEPGMMGDVPQLRNPAGGLAGAGFLPGGTGSRLHAVFLRSRDLRRGGRCGNGSGGLRLILFCFPIEAAAGIWPIRQGTVVAIEVIPTEALKSLLESP